MSPQLTIPAEGTYSDIERDLIDNEPPGLFPGDQNSYWGQLRKVFADYLQVLADQLTTWYDNLDPRLVDSSDMDEWEAELGIPTDAGSRTLDQRRAFVLSRLGQGAFTRTRRRNLVESFITATFGVTMVLTPAGVPLVPGGVPLFGEPTSLVGLYAIVEDIPNMTYHVRIKDTILIDVPGLTRELGRITPDGITFDIALVPVP